MNDIVEQYRQDSEQWLAELEDLFAYVAHRFGRREMQERALDYLTGLLRPAERKNGWQLAGGSDNAGPWRCNTAARPDESRIARSACSSAMPARMDALYLTANCICRRTGRAIPRDAQQPRYRKRWSSPPRRSWHGWYRHVTLAMLAHAYLANLNAQAIDAAGIKKTGLNIHASVEKGTARPCCIALTVPEIRKVLWQLVWPYVPHLIAVIAWSLWRRRHQAVARECRYRRRGATP